MRKVSWLVVGLSLVLSLALMSCGYVKKDEFEMQLSDHKMDVDQKIQLAQDAAAEAGDKADEVKQLASRKYNDLDEYVRRLEKRIKRIEDELGIERGD